jgi:hypothetical protein
MWDQHVSPLRLEVRNTPGTHVYINQTNECGGTVQKRTGPPIKFKDTEIFSKTMGYVDRPVKEATEIQLYPNNINREQGFKLRHAWNPLLKYYKKNDTNSALTVLDGQENNDRQVLRNRQRGRCPRFVGVAPYWK